MKTRFVCLLTGWLFAGATLAQPRYTVVPLTPIIGEAATVDSINDHGDMAGRVWTPEFDTTEVYRLEKGKLPERLGILSTWYDLAFINNQGQVAGTYWFDLDLRILRGFIYSDDIYSDDGVFVDIGTLGGPRTVVFGLNNLGQVTGESDTVFNLSDEPDMAFRYTPGLGMQALGTLPGGRYTTGYAINDQGWVAGSADTTNSVTHDWPDERTWHTFRFTDQTGMVDVGGLPVGGASDGYPTAMNNRGVIVGAGGGGGAPEVGFAPKRGFIVACNTVEELPNLGGNDTVPEDINDFNVVVGRDNHLDTFGLPVVRRAFIWTESEGMLDLNDLIDPVSSVSLSGAWSINNRGQILAWATPGAVLLNPIPPKLTVQQSPTNVVVSWTPNWPGVVLESTTSLGAPEWQAVGTGGPNVLTVSATNTMRFFRLNLDALRGLCWSRSLVRSS